MRDFKSKSETREADIVLGDDWVKMDQGPSPELRERRRGFRLRNSPLTSKIIKFNLIALNILVACILFLNHSRDGVLVEHAKGMVAQSTLIADVFRGYTELSDPSRIDPVEVDATLNRLTLREGLDVYVFDANGAVLGHVRGRHVPSGFDGDLSTAEQPTSFFVDALIDLWLAVSAPFRSDPSDGQSGLGQQLANLVPLALNQGTQFSSGLDRNGAKVYLALTPITADGTVLGAVAMTSPSGEVDALSRAEQEQILLLFLVAILVSIGLSFVLASTIANPLADLAAAAEIGHEHNRRRVNPGRIRIPDLSARPDEIGRLSAALRGMVSALYDRIDGNEQFAADVAHEIKNPLASLQSAVGTLRVVKRDDQREKLLEVIEHDVRRLDRLVSDISNASRLDAELVKEVEEEFDLRIMLQNLSQYLGEDARDKGIDFLVDLPSQPVMIQGLEARLAQVFVNLLDNAISFCEEGDAIRVWARRRDRHVLIAVEDTGPGVPEQALTKIFKRFYSQRPQAHFGNNSGLGLAISKQIVEAHGGVIWAENIRRTKDAPSAGPLGARFVVGLPL